MERQNVKLARRLIQESLRRYRHLQEGMYQVDRSANFLEFGDTTESLLRAGLVAYAMKKWESAIGLFRFVEKNAPKLQEKVFAVKADIEAKLSPAAFAVANTEGEGLTLKELLAWWLK